MTGHIFIEGEIGGEVTVKSVRADIAQYPHAKEWLVHTNSGGGDVDEGYAIGNIIGALKNTTAQIGAACCSITTYIVESCEKVIMAPHGDFMIHLPTGSLQGNEHDFIRGAERLRRIKNDLADKYMKRVGPRGKITRDQVLAMIEKETSMSPNEALEYGFIDEVQEKLKAVAKFDITKFKDMETLTKEEANGLFKSLGDKLDKFLNKFKNVVQIALADGTMATSTAETPDALVGSNIIGADGKPLSGEIETADGYVITADEAGLVSAYEPLMADKNKDSNKEVEALKKQVEDLTAQLSAKATEATQAVQAQAKLQTEFKNSVTSLKKEVDELKSKTFGDTDVPGKYPKFKADNKDDEEEIEVDPMLAQMHAELASSYLTSRTTNFKNN